MKVWPEYSNYYLCPMLKLTLDAIEIIDAIDRGEADGYSELEMPDEQQERPTG